MRFSVRSLWFRVLAFLFGVYAAIVVAMMFEENSLVYHPLRFSAGDWHTSELQYEDVDFTAGDGVKLNGWWIPAEHPRAYVLFHHGNAGNVRSRVDFAQVMHDRMHVAMFMYDYRGFGRSDGAPTETGVLDDGRSARKWLAAKAGIPEQQIVELGESLGGGVAVDLAAKDGARGLILISTFSSLPDVAGSVYPWLPVHLLMRNRLDSAAKIGAYHRPLLEIQGDQDTIVPYWSAQRLFAAANPPKTFVTIEGGDHNDPPTNKTFDAIDKFLGELK